MEKEITFTRDALIEDLRDALRNLYDFEYLRTSPLTQVFKIHDRFDASRALQKILIDGINAFKPPADEPDQSQAWRIFDSLFCCFVQQLKQQIVADQLCISPRQLRREQRIAIESLADYLWDEYHLYSVQNVQNVPMIVGENPELIKELEWIKELHPTNPTNLSNELASALEVIKPLSLKKNVSFDLEIPSSLPPLAIHAVVLNQILVNVLNAAVNRAVEGKVVIRTKKMDWFIQIILSVPQINESTRITPIEQSANLSTATKMAELSSIDLEITKDENHNFKAALNLPIREMIPVLLIDDNKDALELFHRYSAGSRYRLVTTRDPDEIPLLVEQYKPKSIVLDIMMPNNNGWKILGMLRNHPNTANIPVIVCTILPQRELALSLGAADFINKPINRDDFLACLNQHNYSSSV